MNKFLAVLGVLFIAGGVGSYFTLFTVNEREQAIVLEFGDFRRTVSEPGLHFKLPYQDVRRYEKRILDLNPDAEPVLLADQKRLIVDTFVRYRIEDPLLFFQSLRDENQAEGQLNNLVNAAVRNILGNTTLTDLLSSRDPDTNEFVRVEKMNDIANQVRERVQQQRYGIEIVDVRIRRADLPEATSQAIYDRMRSEREREAAEFRAQGQEERERIESSADREVAVLRANAERDAEIIRGEGDQQAIQIYADAYGADPEFYAFYRSLEAYRRSLANSDTTLVLSPESEFFRFFGDLSGGVQDLPQVVSPAQSAPSAAGVADADAVLNREGAPVLVE